MRGHNEGSVYRRKRDGRWMATVTMPNGRRRSRLAPADDNTRAGARRVNEELLDERDAAREPGATSRLGPFLRRWIDETRPSLRPSTLRTYELIVRLHLEPELGGYRLTELTVPIVQSYLRRLGESLSSQTVAHHRALLRRVLNTAIRWGLLQRNVAALTDPPHIDRADIRPLTAAEVQTLVSYTEGDRMHALWLVAATTGLRQAELLGLTWRDVDLEASSLRVERTLGRIEGQWVLVEPKTKKSRRVLPLIPSAVTALRAHRRRQSEERLASGAGGAYEGLVFTSEAGQPLQSSQVLRSFHRALQGAGLPEVRFLDLRHGYATLMLEAGVHPRVVMELMGHSSIKLTMETYSHVVPELGREAAEKIERALRGAG
jgi:integrase